MDETELAKQTLDQIPKAQPSAKRITGLVKEGGMVTGYQLSDNSIVEKQQAVDMAKQGKSPVSGSLIGVVQNTRNPSPMGAKTTISVISPQFLLKL